MNKVKILTDSCSDIPKEWRDKYDIDYARLPLLWEGKECLATCDWENFSAREFYEAISQGKSIKTNQVAVNVFEDIFNKYLDEGMDIVYVGCTSALSGTVSAGAMVAQNIMKARQDAKIFVIDPPISCGGEALLAVEAAKLAQSGLSAEEVAKSIKELADHAVQVGSIGTLEFLKRAGRIKATAAFFGNLFGIKPIIVNDGAGNNVAIRKVKGRQNSIDTCIDLFCEAVTCPEQTVPITEQTVYIGHADCLETAEYIKEALTQKLGPKEIYINYIGPCIGASTGPTMFGIYGFGKRIST